MSLERNSNKDWYDNELAIAGVNRTYALHDWKFERRHSYWSVKCVGKGLPMANAITMANKLTIVDGKFNNYIRVAGHAGCPMPNEKFDEHEDFDPIKYENLIGKTVWANGHNCIDLYHVDTLEGLKYLVWMINHVNDPEKFPSLITRIRKLIK